MSVTKTIMTMLGASLVLAACTSSPKGIQVTNPAPATPPPVVSPTDKGGEKADPSQTAQTGEASVELDQKELQQTYALDINNLTYKFTYLTATQNGKITFDATGKSLLTFKDLPSEQAGVVTLEVSEGTTLKLRGTSDSVTLAKGKSTQIKMTLKSVDPNAGGSGGQTTDLTIDVSLDNTANPPAGGTTTTTTPPAGGTTTTTPPTGGTTTTTTTPPTGGTTTTTTTPPTDPIATWDGKSNLGNSKWSIVTVN